MRVAFDTTPATLGGGGVAVYARTLLDRLRHRDDVEVVELSDDRSGAGGLGRVIAGVQREAVYYPYAISRRARLAGADLIHCPAGMPVRRRDVPVVLTIHDAIPLRNPEWFTRANALQQRLLLGPAARSADRVITDSQASKTDLVDLVGLDPDRVDVIYPGIAPEFDPGRRDRDWLAARFGVTGPVVLSVGTPEPRKNLPGTIAAFTRAQRAVPDAHLLLVGADGWRSTEIERAIAAAGDAVVRAGRLSFDELVRTYASADCFLFPSLLEGFGFPPLEAMASGLPVVCSDRPSLPEVVGDAALLAPPDAVDTLADHVIAVLTDTRQADDLRTAGLAHARRFSWDDTVSQTISAYRCALA